MQLGHVYNAKSAFVHVGDDFIKKQAAFDEAEIIGLNNEEIGIAQGLRHPAKNGNLETVRVEVDHIGTGQTGCADLMVDGGLSHDLARAFALYLAREPCEQVTVVEVDFPARVPAAARTY